MKTTNPDLSMTGVFTLIWRHRILLLSLAVITAILSSVVALILPVYYRSTLVIFPTRTHSVEVNNSNVKRGNISDFGDDEETEILLQVLQSEEMVLKTADRLDLFDHYDIDRTSSEALTSLRDQFRGNVTSKKTRYNSIKIEVLDKDAQKAADIANGMGDLMDEVKNQMIRERATKSLTAFDVQEKSLQKQLDKVSKQLESLQKRGVVSGIERTSLYEAYGRVLSAGNSSAASEFKASIDSNIVHGNTFDILKRERDGLKNELINVSSTRRQFTADSSLNIPQKFLLDRAEPADQKAKPVRSMIVVSSVFSVVLFAICLLVFREVFPSIQNGSDTRSRPSS